MTSQPLGNGHICFSSFMKNKNQDKGCTFENRTFPFPMPIFSNLNSHRENRNFTNYSDIDICSASFLHNADDESSVQREQKNKMFMHRQTVDAGTQKAEGKWGEKKKKQDMSTGKA